MTTIKSALFVENALSDSSFSQHDSHAANADFSKSMLELRAILGNQLAETI